MKNKDYYIINIRQYADNRLLKDFNSKKCQEQHHKRFDSYFSFWMKFVEKVTGISYKDWIRKYMSDSIDMDYYMMESFKSHNVHVRRWRDAIMTYYIPKTNLELFEWVKNNLTDNPYKIMKRSPKIY